MRKHVAVHFIILFALVLSACASSATEPAPAASPPAAEQATTAPEQTQPETTAPPAAMTTAPEAPDAQPTTAAPAAFTEPPVLAEQVQAGKLPSIEERLPERPAVVAPLIETGKHGGTMRIGFVGTNPGWGGLWFFTGWENLAIWKPDFSGVEPNIAESWEVSEDAREYTFNLRKGMKWSDGEPFTADDIMFYIDDILLDEEISPAGPSADWLPSDQVDGFKATKVDDYTVTFSFPKPYGTFLYNLATWSGRHVAFFPKHYLQQFHKKYNPDVVEQAKTEEGVKDWIGLFNKRASGPTEDIQNFYNTPERPVLFPWIVKEPLGTGTTITLVRNPYYWKVDDQGNQLPYIDEIVGTSFQDAESRTFAMLNGDLDAIKDPGNDNRVLYYDALDEGKPLQIRTNYSDGGNTNSIHFNRTVEDPNKAEIFANKDFRIGMSYAINRQEIIDIAHQGQGSPAQVAPLEDSPLYNERLATQYLEFDVAKANEHLDKVLPEKDADGFRTDKTGRRLSIVMSVSSDLSYGTNWVQIAELLTKYWGDVGVEVKLNAMPDKQFVEFKKQNKLEASMYTGEGGAGITPILDPRYYVPMEYFGLYGNGWHAWFTKSSEAKPVEPPQEIKDFRAEFEEVLSSPTQEEQISKMQDILEKAADEFWVIGISRPGPGYDVFHSRVSNIPESWTSGWIEGVQKITYPEQWYINE
jgi:peptide/nickel transport system substrate-binding protein